MRSISFSFILKFAILYIVGVLRVEGYSEHPNNTPLKKHRTLVLYATKRKTSIKRRRKMTHIKKRRKKEDDLKKKLILKREKRLKQ
jgi:hypothetical protein